jgi:NitT/TauT family transport system substrate-binding protein
MDQSMKIKDATGKDVFPIKFADYGINLVSSGIVVNKDWLKENADLVKRFMSAATKSLEEASKNPRDAAQAILNANPKGGKIETLTQGFELTIPLYKDPSGKTNRPFNVSDANMKATVDVMVEYGGLETKAKDELKNYYSNAYLPGGSGG